MLNQTQITYIQSEFAKHFPETERILVVENEEHAVIHVIITQSWVNPILYSCQTESDEVCYFHKHSTDKGPSVIAFDLLDDNQT